MDIAAMYEKPCTQSNANQSAHAMRVGTALEAAEMRVFKCDKPYLLMNLRPDFKAFKLRIAPRA